MRFCQRLDERAELAQHPFGPDLNKACKHCGIFRFDEPWYLREPRGRKASHQREEASGVRTAADALKRRKNGQIGFASAGLLNRPTLRNEQALAAISRAEALEERLDQGGLPDTRLAGHQRDLAPPTGGAPIQRFQLMHLRGSAHKVRLQLRGATFRFSCPPVGLRPSIDARHESESSPVDGLDEARPLHVVGEYRTYLTDRVRQAIVAD